MVTLVPSPSEKPRNLYMHNAVVALLKLLNFFFLQMQARDLPRIVQVAYHLIPYFIFSAQEGSRSALFAATDPQIPEYCGVLKSDDWPVCAFISHDCRPMNASEEAHNIETSHKVWAKTLDLIGLPSDAVEKLLEGEEIRCRYGPNRE
ncbi:dehydrogenase/reductase SDR family member FEY-like [Telopea speciosissima]|uniref:dehydrogenase/reductase SDR family member FEY-like n=1 Tax=Telopea speciosissima TaxID=54955 RepID=UPI001CC3A136|nr:dehydrogenase/reductase SDR family member FEY-like [Telopea speciosissima]